MTITITIVQDNWICKASASGFMAGWLADIIATDQHSR